MPKIFTVDPRNPKQAIIDEIGNLLRAGGIIAYPTETFYGLGADSRNDTAIRTLFSIKGRDFDKPIPIIIGSRHNLNAFTHHIPEKGTLLMDTFWPGGLTLLFNAAPEVSSKLTAGTGKIGIRVSSHPVASRLAEAISGAITSTSANISGDVECSTSDAVIDILGDKIDAIVDGGPTPGGKGSTIVDITVDPPVTIREGVISEARITETLRKI